MLRLANPLTMLMALQSEQHTTELVEKRSSIRSASDRREATKQAIEDAIEEAREAEEERGFWGGIAEDLATVGEIAAVAGVAASVVATGGVSAPAALMVAGLVISHTADDVAKELDLGEEGAMALRFTGAGMSIAGGGWNALTSSGVATQTQIVAQQAGSVATAVGGGATATQGYAQMRSGVAGSDAEDHRSDEREERAMQRFLNRELDAIIDRLKEMDKSYARAKSTIAQTQRDQLQTMHNIANFGSPA